MITRATTNRRQIIEALLAIRPLRGVAKAVGLHDHTGLWFRMKSLGIRRIRTPEFLIIEVRP